MNKVLSFLKTNLKAIIALLVIAAMTAGILVLTNSSRAAGVSMMADEQVISAKAVKGDVSSLFYGSGTLEDEEYETVELPDTVEVTSYAVRTGERVEKGEKIARVDKASVMKAIADLQDAIEKLDEDITQAADDSITSSRFANCSCRVKEIYAGAGDSVRDVMYKHGSLVVLSLDGYMACDLPSNGNQSIGDMEKIVRDDGTVLEATVSKLDNGIMTVICSDDGTRIGEKVTVTDESGVYLGEGELYIHVPEYVTGFTGTVETVFVEKEDLIATGQTVISYTDTGYSGEYDRLLDIRREYEETVEELFEAAYDGYLRAPADGIITDIDETVEYRPVAEGLGFTEGRGGISLLSVIGQKIDMVLLSSQSGELPEPSSSPAPTPSPEPSTGYTRAAIVDAINGLTLSVRFYPGNVSPTEDISMLPADGFTEPGTITMDSYVPGIIVGAYLSVDYNAEGQMTGFAVVKSGGGGNIPGGGGMSGFGGGMYGISGNDGIIEEEPYALSQKTLFSVIPAKEMTITVSVDELDILSLDEGQEAVVTLDAFPGQSFEGVVTNIDPTGTNEGGTTKYSATVTIARNDSMLSGMNASACITLTEKKGVLLIPLSAISEKGGKTLVYTGYDGKEDALLNPVEITTGLSDGENAEVTSGLSEGDTVYYRYADSVSIVQR